MKKSLIFIALLYGLASCVYPYDVELGGESKDVIVLDGNIVVGGKSTLRLSRMYPFSEEFSTNYSEVTGTAWVEDDQGGVYTPDDPLVPRSVFSISTDDAPAGRKYRMGVNVDGARYLSDWLEVKKAPVIEDVYIGYNLDSTAVKVDVTLDGGEDATGYIGISFDETWEFHADYECRYVWDPERKVLYGRSEPFPNYWCWRNMSSVMHLINYSDFGTNRINDFTIQSFPTSNNRNHKKYSINIKAITLSEQAFKYIKNLDDITEGMGSLFTPNPGEMPSNIICETDPSVRVMGYVTASLQAERREFIDNRFYSHPTVPTGYLYIPAGVAGMAEAYEFGDYPVDLMNLPKGDKGAYVEGIYWGPIRCIDCVLNGGTKQKPDFWE